MSATKTGVQMDHVANLKTYAQGVQEVINHLPYDDIAKVVDAIWKNVNEGKCIYTMGNGGHCNTASHMINDLAKHTVSSDDKTAVVSHNLRFRTACFNDSMSFITGIGNDMGFDHIFSEQVINWVKPGDIVLGVSGSGNSKNILNAFEEPRKSAPPRFATADSRAAKPATSLTSMSSFPAPRWCRWKTFT